MSDEYDDDDNTQDPPNGDSKLLRQLRKQVAELTKKASENEARATKAERQSAFLEAGVDMANKAAPYFVKGYDGEITVEAIKTAAEEAGLLVKVAEPKPEPNQQQNPEAQQQANPYWADTQSFEAMQQATSFQNTTGENLHKGMAEAIEKGGIEGMTAYMRSHGIPVVDEG